MRTLTETIQRLEWERQQIDKALATLKVLLDVKGDQPGKRGRKGMGHAERLEVSRRMKAYWAEQRRRRA